MHNFLAGNAWPLRELPPKEELEAAGYGFYASGAMEQLAGMSWEEITEQDVVWAGTPDRIIERVEAVRAKCEGLAEIAITVNAGGTDHWKAIKTQELFARHVIPHFREAGAEAQPLEPAVTA